MAWPRSCGNAGRRGWSCAGGAPAASLGDQPRRRVYRDYVASGELPAGYATEDGVGLHYIGTELHEAVAMRDGARAWWVEPCLGGGYHDKAIRPRRL